jgi:hypothetical protein
MLCLTERGATWMGSLTSDQRPNSTNVGRRTSRLIFILSVHDSRHLPKAWCLTVAFVIPHRAFLSFIKSYSSHDISEISLVVMLKSSGSVTATMTWLTVTNDQWYTPFVVITIRSLPHLWHISRYVTRENDVGTCGAGTAYPSEAP